MPFDPTLRRLHAEPVRRRAGIVSCCLMAVGLAAAACGSATGAGVPAHGTRSKAALTRASTTRVATPSTTTTTTTTTTIPNLPTCGSPRDPFDPTGSPPPAGSPALC